MNSKSLRFVTFLAPSIRPLYQYIADSVGERLQLATSLTVAKSYKPAVDGSMDVGFICSLPYVQLTREDPKRMVPIAAPVLRGERYQERPIYYSDVIVRRDRPYRSFAELRGASWAFNEPRSHSGYGIVRETLIKMGETRRFFGQVVRAGYHQRSIRLVREGAVDASAIDSQVLEVELRDHPALLDDLKVIDQLGPSPIQPVVTSGRLPESLRSEIRQVLLELATEPAAQGVLAGALVERFVAADRDTYTVVQAQLERAERLGFTQIR